MHRGEQAEPCTVAHAGRATSSSTSACADGCPPVVLHLPIALRGSKAEIAAEHSISSVATDGKQHRRDMHVLSKRKQKHNKSKLAKETYACIERMNSIFSSSNNPLTHSPTHTSSLRLSLRPSVTQSRRPAHLLTHSPAHSLVHPLPH